VVESFSISFVNIYLYNLLTYSTGLWRPLGGREAKICGGKVLMSVAERNISLATDLPKYELFLTINVIGALARNFTYLHSPPPGMRLWARTPPDFLRSLNSSDVIKKYICFYCKWFMLRLNTYHAKFHVVFHWYNFPSYYQRSQVTLRSNAV
jgi:hypothetical protein